MSTRKRRLFRAAFRAKTGRILNFGCANDDAARDVLDQLCRQWRPSHNSTRVYDFVFDGSRLAQYRAADPEFFCGDSLNISRSLAQCQAFLHRRKIACYSQKIADAAGVGCWAAFPGTSSGYEQDVPFPVMSVRKDSTRSGRDFTPYLHFINLRLGYVEDSMGRGFVEFTSRRLKKPSGRARDRSPATMADRDGAVTHPSGAMPMKGQTNS
jgi:hypothetical protein